MLRLVFLANSGSKALKDVANSEVANNVVNKSWALGEAGFGFLIGCVVTCFLFWLTTKERIISAKARENRIKALEDQTNIKDDEIRQLHVELGKLQNKNAKLQTSKKKP